MARKRQRRRAQANAAAESQGHHAVGPMTDGNGVTVNIRQIGKSDEGVLYTHRITERSGAREKTSSLAGLFRLFRRRDHSDSVSVGSARSEAPLPYRRTVSRASADGRNNNIVGPMPSTPLSPPPQSETLKGFRTFFGKHQKQYTIASKKKYSNKILNWFDKHHMDFVDYFWHSNEVDNNVYRPSASLYRYIDWTFTASFTNVFISFLIFYFVLCLVFGGLLMAAGQAEPNCIVASGVAFGKSEIPHTAWSDAFALSWTTFTTVGYGMTYTSTAGDFGDTEPHKCTWVVFLCTSEAFLGLLFAGMCAAILFGKVNRTQSHANLIFCNAVCLQYEEMDDEYDGPDNGESERSHGPPIPGFAPSPLRALEDEENQAGMDMAPQSQHESKFVDQFNGCPILKFQVVNELCNREGGELVDCIMKVVGIKFKGPNGTVTHSQYVRVNLVDFEHPFLSRVWHGVHILDSSSPLLTDRARHCIRENKGSWPSTWLDPEIIRSKLEFHDLIVTVAGISNVSAVTVHAYKRYKIGDVLIGYNFAPIVFRNTDTGALEVELSMCHDVREQYGIRGEDLSIRRSGSKDLAMSGRGSLTSTIRIKKSKSGDGLGSVTSHNSGRSLSKLPLSAESPDSSGRDSTPNTTNEKMVSPLECPEAETSEDEVCTNQVVYPNENQKNI
eukprot:CAMPEP_0172539204 /NCGR_PEP_ID=MMETSP1067-20121228/10462_1 /TAXON_ID=265564 ORGANISM="Thalassiosira punctigera, Strain Tpunct2005C2" /NCGR_SAMPLE_ID=MMETSP1067 /ASSEMBLY_ACC=CAM_ASM_000444 /LENGTH=669 /DNA_ID=CAMNT_0013324853 /DNA_START=106 /DNA_END=2115 /DNA_ORIENTATION=+